MSEKKLDILSDLKIEEIEIKNADLDKFSGMLKSYNINIYDYLPKKKQHKVSFILNSSAAFANFIRTAIWDITPIWSLKVETESIPKSDPFLLTDDIEQKIHGIPIMQSFFNKAFAKDGDNIYKKFRASFSVMNDTTALKTITSHDIKFEYDGKELKTEDMCSMIPFFRIQVGKHVSANLTIELGYGIIDANKFNTVDAREYKILSHKHMIDGGPSSLEYDPDKFYLSYTTYRNFDDPLEILFLIIEDNLKRIKKLEEKIKEFAESKSTILHHLDYNFMQFETQTRYEMNESYFFTELLNRYIFDSKLGTPEYVTSDTKHLLEYTSFVIVQAQNANERMLDACNTFQEDLLVIKKIISKS